MIHLNKTAGRDFVILNLTDTQLSNEEWADGSQKRAILEYTGGENPQVNPHLCLTCRLGCSKIGV